MPVKELFDDFPVFVHAKHENAGNDVDKQEAEDARDDWLLLQRFCQYDKIDDGKYKRDNCPESKNTETDSDHS